MKSLVRRLRRRLKVPTLSNNTKERVNYLNHRYSLHKEFDAYFYSFNYGLMKPDPRLFEKVLQKLGLKACEVIIVDDKPDILKIANNIGMKTILFQSAKQVEREIFRKSLMYGYSSF